MGPDAPHGDLLRELGGLAAEYVETRLRAQEAQARGYDALFASTASAAHAHQLCRRAVRAFEQAALVLETVDEARDTRRQLLQTSQALASLFGVTLGADPEHEARQTGPANQPLSLRHVLHELDRTPSGHDGRSLHERMLSAAGAASAALNARRRTAR